MRRLWNKLCSVFTLERIVRFGLFILTAVVFFTIGYQAPRDIQNGTSQQLVTSDENVNSIALEIESNPSEQTESVENQTSKIGINSATLEELMSVPGIGETFAQRIIDYRDENGEFRDLSELMEISGIGEKRYNQWKEYFSLD